jgi:hypothetical protein
MVLAIFGTSLLGFPTADVWFRANLEGLIWIAYVAGIGYMFTRKWTKSASILAIASSIKPYPAFLLILLFWRRKYAQLVLGCFVLVATVIGSLALLGKGNPKEGLSRISNSSSSPFFGDYIVGFQGVAEASYDHSLFQASKSVARVVRARGARLPAEDYASQKYLRVGYVLLAVYIPVAALFLGLVLWRVRKKPFLTQMFALSICLTLVPLIAGEYTLTILYVPMGLFLLFLLREVVSGRVYMSYARLLSILVSCAWLMSPLTLFDIWKGDVKTIILLFLLYIVMDTPMPMSIDLDQGSNSCGEMIELRVESGT